MLITTVFASIIGMACTIMQGKQNFQLMVSSEFRLNFENTKTSVDHELKEDIVMTIKTSSYDMEVTITKDNKKFLEETFEKKYLKRDGFKIELLQSYVRVLCLPITDVKESNGLSDVANLAHRLESYSPEYYFLEVDPKQEE